jgi:hypothetical protein
MKTNKSSFVYGPHTISKSMDDASFDIKQYKNGNLITLSIETDEQIEKFSLTTSECPGFYAYKDCTDAKKCLFDYDCLGDEHCQFNYCYDIICDQCQYIKDRKCVDYECCNPEQCYNDQFCIENRCADLDCSQGFYPNMHKCEKDSSHENDTIMLIYDDINTDIALNTSTNTLGATDKKLNPIIKFFKSILNLFFDGTKD